MKRILIIVLIAVMLIIPNIYGASEPAKENAAEEKVNVHEFVKACNDNCRRQFAYVYRNAKSNTPDLLAFLVYNHPKDKKGDHGSVYGVIIYSNKSGRPVWGGVGKDFHQIFEPIPTEFKSFFAGSHVLGLEISSSEQEIFQKVRDLFGNEGDRPKIIRRKMI